MLSILSAQKPPVSGPGLAMAESCMCLSRRYIICTDNVRPNCASSHSMRRDLPFFHYSRSACLSMRHAAIGRPANGGRTAKQQKKIKSAGRPHGQHAGRRQAGHQISIKCRPVMCSHAMAGVACTDRRAKQYMACAAPASGRQGRTAPASSKRPATDASIACGRRVGSKSCHKIPRRHTMYI